MKKFEYPLELTARSWDELQKVITCVFIHWGYKVYGISASSKDTEFTYDLYVCNLDKSSIKKLEVEAVRNFIIGVVTCYWSMR